MLVPLSVASFSSNNWSAPDPPGCSRLDLWILSPTATQGRPGGKFCVMGKDFSMIYPNAMNYLKYSSMQCNIEKHRRKQAYNSTAPKTPFWGYPTIRRVVDESNSGFITSQWRIYSKSKLWVIVKKPRILWNLCFQLLCKRGFILSVITNYSQISWK